MKRRITAILLLAAMLTACASCGGSTPAPGEDTLPPDTTTDTESTESSLPIDHIPENDFGGYEFRILNFEMPPGWNTWTHSNDLYAESATGEILNDAVWQRNQAIEERYNVVFSIEFFDYKQIVDQINRLVAADEDAYDMVFARLYEAPQMIYNQSLLDLNELPVVDFSKPWWDSNSIDNLSIGGKLYLAASDITIMDKDSTDCILYNKKLAEEYKVGDLYDTVRSGKWTFDTMHGHMKGVTGDLNGDTVIDTNDRFGLLGSHTTIGGMFRGAGCRIADKDENDIPYLTFESERNFSVIEKIFDITYTEDFFNMHLADISNQEFRDMFAEDKGLFFYNIIEVVSYLRTKNVEFGILPVPKYEESQDNYLSMINVHQSGLLSVPKTIRNPECTGTIIEALAAESSITVQPAFYDINLNVKGVRDEESVEMLDLIFDNRIYDLGDIYNFATFSYRFLCIQSTGSRDIASFWAGYKESVQADLDKLLETLELN